MRLNFQFLSQLGETLGFNKARPPGEGYYLYALLFFIGYLAADLATFYMRGMMLPSGGVQAPRNFQQMAQKPASQSYYNNIESRNIFNSDHLVVKSVEEIKDPQAVEQDGKPVKSTLPLDLIGTIVHGNKKKSVATVQIKGAKEIEPFKVGETIDGKAKITEITREQVIFRNLRSQKLEYIELEEDSKFKIGLADPNASLIEEEEEEPTDFAFTRDEIDKHLENLPQILQDAKAVPYVVPGSGGQVDGFKLVAIKPGSIYEKLGLKRGDILKGVNGEKVNSPQRAMELYQTLKNADSISLEISRGGSTKNLNYQIR